MSKAVWIILDSNKKPIYTESSEVREFTSEKNAIDTAKQLMIEYALNEDDEFYILKMTHVISLEYLPPKAEVQKLG